MREALAQVFDPHPAGVVIVSMFDDYVLYMNRRSRELFKSRDSDVSWPDLIVRFEGEHGLQGGCGLATMGSIRDDKTAWGVCHTRSAGGLWLMATGLHDVEGYPPAAVLTITPGRKTDAARVHGAQVHLNITMGARIAIQLDEAVREMTTAVELTVHASKRINALRNDLVHSMQEYADPDVVSPLKPV